MFNPFKKEFDFIFKTKEEMEKPVTHEVIQNKISALQKIYCLDFYHFDQNTNPVQQRVVRFFDVISNIYENNFIPRDYESYVKATEEARQIALPLLNKKHEMLQKIRRQHAELIDTYPDLYSLRFSLNLQRKEMFPVGMSPLEVKQRCIHMGYFVGKFLNNMRQRVHLKNKIGHFWCFMKEPNETPYIHMNLYFRHGNFNASRAMDFLDLWMKVTDGTGSCILFDFPEDYNNTVIYNDKNRVEQITTITIPKIPATASHIVVNDFNQANSHWKYITETSGKPFQGYLSQVVRETYPVYTLSTFPRVCIPEAISPSADTKKRKINGLKVRSYALSQ